MLNLLEIKNEIDKMNNGTMCKDYDKISFYSEQIRKRIEAMDKIVKRSSEDLTEGDKELWRSYEREVKTLEEQISEIKNLDEIRKMGPVSQSFRAKVNAGSDREQFIKSVKRAIETRAEQKVTLEFRAEPIMTGAIETGVKVTGIKYEVPPHQALLGKLGVTFVNADKNGAIVFPDISKPSLAIAKPEGSTYVDASINYIDMKIGQQFYGHVGSVTKEVIASTGEDILGKIFDNLVDGVYRAVVKDIVTKIEDASTREIDMLDDRLAFNDITNMESEIGMINENYSYLGNKKMRAHLKATPEFEYGNIGIWKDERVNEKPAYANNEVSDNKLILGDFSYVGVGVWQGVEILIDPFTLATSGIVRFVVDANWNSGLINENAFVILKDASIL